MFAYSLHPNFIDSAICEELSTWFDKRFDHYSPDIEGVENVRQLLGDEISNIPLLSKLLLNIEQVIDEKNSYKVSFDKMWLVKTQSSDVDMSKLPYIPHFDKRRYLKGMLYLTDVGPEDGPIHLTSFVDDSIDIKRRKLPQDYKAKSMNSVTLEGENLPRPIIGDAGMLVLFDTNTPHHAGLVQTGKVRKVLRLDFEDPRWNRQPIIKKLLTRFGVTDGL